MSSSFNHHRHHHPHHHEQQKDDDDEQRPSFLHLASRLDSKFSFRENSSRLLEDDDEDAEIKALVAAQRQQQDVTDDIVESIHEIVTREDWFQVRKKCALMII
jgi:hypothetical protein